MRHFIFGGSVLLVAALYFSFGAAQTKPDNRLIDSIKGPALYQSYCASCHGADGTGGGPMTKALVLPPSDLTHIAAHNGGTFPLARVSRIISGEEQFLPHRPQFAGHAGLGPDLLAGRCGSGFGEDPDR